VPRYDFSTVPSLDRVLVPAGVDVAAKQQVIAAWSVDRPHTPVEDVFQNVGKGETAYDATFEDLAQTQGAALARADASLLYFVIDPARLQGTDWLGQDWLSPLLLAVVGVAFVYVVTHPKRARRTRFQPGADWSEAVDWARDVERYGFDSYWVSDHPALFRADCWTAPGGARRGHSKTVTRHVRVLHGVPQPDGPRSLRGRSSPVECWTTDPWCWERRPSAGIRNARLAHWDRSPARRDAAETVVVVWRLLNGGKVSRDGRHVHLIDVELDAVAGGFAKRLTCRL